MYEFSSHIRPIIRNSFVFNVDQGHNEKKYSEDSLKWGAKMPMMRCTAVEGWGMGEMFPPQLTMGSRGAS